MVELWLIREEQTGSHDARLRELASSAVGEVTAGVGGEALRGVVRQAQRTPEKEAQCDRIFGASDRSGLILISCDGDFDSEAGVNPDRLIVCADLLPAES